MFIYKGECYECNIFNVMHRQADIFCTKPIKIVVKFLSGYKNVLFENLKIDDNNL